MKGKTENKIIMTTMLVVLVVGGLSIFLFGEKIFLLINPQQYNGNFDDWCINTDTSVTTRQYGFLNGGDIRCTVENSVTLDSVYDETTNKHNEMPLYWKNHYGCCIARSSDAHSGDYSVLLSKTTFDDWYYFGLSNNNGVGAIPAQPNLNYQWSFYYKGSLNAGRPVRFSVYYFDSTNAVTHSDSTEITAASNWTKFTKIITSPANTVKMGYFFTFPSDTNAQFYIDSLEIDDGNVPCTQGTQQICGSDIGACKKGVQLCTTSGVWGECGGTYVGPIQEVCGNDIDDDCDGLVDENCVFTPYTKTELVSAYDIINMKTYSGTGLSSKDKPGWWAWDNAPIVESQINMYVATKDKKYLDFAIANTDYLISKTSDSDGDGYLDWWALESKTTSDFNLDYSRNVLPIIKLAYIIKKDKISEYDSKAQTYISFVENNIVPVYNLRWFECGNMGFWAECQRKSNSDNSCVEGTQRSAPNNRIAYVGRIYAYLWAITDKQDYYDKSVRYANKIKSTLNTLSGGPTAQPYYYWNYNNKAGCITNMDGSHTRTCSFDCAIDNDPYCLPEGTGGWSCDGALELTYGQYDVSAVMDYYELGIVFTSSDMEKFRRTLTEGFLVESALVHGVPVPVLNWEASGTSSLSAGHAVHTGGAHMWARMGKYDSKIRDVFSKIVKWNVEHAENYNNGNYYDYAYHCVTDLRNTNGELCVPTTQENTRNTPAYTLSMLAHVVLYDVGGETLTKLSSSNQQASNDIIVVIENPKPTIGSMITVYLGTEDGFQFKDMYTKPGYYILYVMFIVTIGGSYYLLRKKRR